MNKYPESLSGEYKKISDTSFFLDKYKVIIRDRKKNIEKKPVKYICFIKPFKYISSLYPLNDNEFRIDYKNKIYEMKIKKDLVKINEV